MMSLFQKPHRVGGCRSNAGAGFRGVARKLKSDQRGSVVVVTALVIPVLVMSAGMGVEVSHWAMVKLELQRTADIAALAGATDYEITKDARSAANAAASVAELNGAAGSTSRTWNESTQLLRDNQITAQVRTGVRQDLDTALEVTVSQPVTLLLTRIMSSSQSVTVSATGWAELRTSVQPCVLALKSGGITFQGSVDVKLTGCSMRSNGSISQTGNAANVSASAFYADGSIDSRVTGTRHEYAGTITDPYLTHSGVQTALGRLVSSPTGNGNGNGKGKGKSQDDAPSPDNETLSSGTWPTWNIKGKLSLNPGIYYVNGDISLGGQAELTGTGVTIVTSGTLSMHGGASITLSAALKPTNPGDAVEGGAIPGVVFVGNSASTSVFRGNTSPALTGVVYYPNGALDFGGTAQVGSPGCLEVIAASVELKGNSSMEANCARYGALPFSSGGPATVVLVQ